MVSSRLPPEAKPDILKNKLIAPTTPTHSRMPRRAPQCLSSTARRGAAGMRRGGGGAGKPLLPALDKHCGAQDQSGIRVAFLLVTFLWPSKEKSLGCRAETRLLNDPSRQRGLKQMSKMATHSPPDNRFKSAASVTPSRSTVWISPSPRITSALTMQR